MQRSIFFRKIDKLFSVLLFLQVVGCKTVNVDTPSSSLQQAEGMSPIPSVASVSYEFKGSAAYDAIRLAAWEDLGGNLQRLSIRLKADSGLANDTQNLTVHVKKNDDGSYTDLIVRLSSKTESDAPYSFSSGDVYSFNFTEEQARIVGQSKIQTSGSSVSFKPDTLSEADAKLMPLKISCSTGSVYSSCRLNINIGFTMKDAETTSPAPSVASVSYEFKGSAAYDAIRLAAWEDQGGNMQRLSIRLKADSGLANDTQNLTVHVKKNDDGSYTDLIMRLSSKTENDAPYSFSSEDFYSFNFTEEQAQIVGRSKIQLSGSSFSFKPDGLSVADAKLMPLKISCSTGTAYSSCRLHVNVGFAPN